MIHIIVAIDRHGAIGSRGDMLFHIREDLRRFRRLTGKSPLIMGRKTFESLPGGALPGRRNIVVTRNAGYDAAGIEKADSLAEAIDMADTSDEDIFIIGGAQIYEQALPIADCIDITVIDADGAAPDTFFPSIPLDDFIVTEIEKAQSQPYVTFYTLMRKTS